MELTSEWSRNWTGTGNRNRRNRFSRNRKRNRNHRNRFSGTELKKGVFGKGSFRNLCAELCFVFFCVLRWFSPANLTEISFRNCPSNAVIFWRTPSRKTPKRSCRSYQNRNRPKRLLLLKQYWFSKPSKPRVRKIFRPQFQGRKWLRQFYGCQGFWFLLQANLRAHIIPRFSGRGVLGFWKGGGEVPVLLLWAFAVLGEKQHEKCHCHAPFCAPPMLVKTRPWEECPPDASRQSTGKITNRPLFAHTQRDSLETAFQIIPFPSPNHSTFLPDFVLLTESSLSRLSNHKQMQLCEVVRKVENHPWP